MARKSKLKEFEELRAELEKHRINIRPKIDRLRRLEIEIYGRNSENAEAVRKQAAGNRRHG